MFFELTKPLYPLVFASLRGRLEESHAQLLKTLHYLDNSRQQPWCRWLLGELAQSFCYQDPRLSQNLWGLEFANPLGLAAGFDKNGLGAGIWNYFGFGFAEVGAVTLHPQPGNPQPRLFRLPQDRAALNRMGANNQGAEILAATLAQSWCVAPRSIPIGINLCKSKVTPLEAAPEDYLGSFRYLRHHADYFVLNVSSPNTPGLRALQSGEQLDRILSLLQGENQGLQPLLIKIAPDLEFEEIAEILHLAQTYAIAGIVATNTTIRREGLKTEILPETGKPIREEAGGISGLPVQQRSTEVIRFIWQQTQGELPIIGVGGIFSAADAWEKINAGASLLQVYTGWLYEGPWLVPQILRQLVGHLEARGYRHLGEVVGKEEAWHTP
jgi:dihydroorotate dehydrogenase